MKKSIVRTVIFALWIFVLGLEHKVGHAEERALLVKPEIGETIRLDKSAVVGATRIVSYPKPYIILTMQPDFTRRLNEMTKKNFGKQLQIIFGDLTLARFVVNRNIEWEVMRISISSEALGRDIVKSMSK